VPKISAYTISAIRGDPNGDNHHQPCNNSLESNANASWQGFFLLAHLSAFRPAGNAALLFSLPPAEPSIWQHSLIGCTSESDLDSIRTYDQHTSLSSQTNPTKAGTIMKRILGIAALTTGITATALAGLVADKGIHITTAATEPTVKEAAAAIVEEKGAPPIATPEVPAKPEEAAPPPQAAEDEPEKAELDALEAEAANTTTVAQAPKACKSSKAPSECGERAFFVAVGRSRATVEAIALGLEFFSSNTWFDGGNWYCVPYLELLAAYWEGDAGHTGITSLHEGGVSTYLRGIRKKQPGGKLRPYADVGLGLHYITEDRIEGKELGRQWLAGSNVGIGLILGESERFDAGLRIRHLSNGGTRDINWGINHYMMRVAVRF
jgi:hypothetical protein